MPGSEGELRGVVRRPGHLLVPKREADRVADEHANDPTAGSR